MVGLIFSIDKNYTIGADGDLCFTSKADMAHFKHNTLVSTCVMGYKTYVSLNGYVLKNREMIVVTSKEIEGVKTVKSIEEAIKVAEYADIWLIGGRGILEEGIDYADVIWMTMFDDICTGKHLVKLSSEFSSKLDQFSIKKRHRLDDKAVALLLTR